MNTKIIYTILKKSPMLQRFCMKCFPGYYFKDSSAYWEKRYAKGGNSGAGSFGHLAQYKADIINSTISEYEVDKVLELGCGDGRQLELLKINRYTGYDVSSTAIKLCNEKFSGNDHYSFLNDLSGLPCDFELVMSIDVIYHLIEDSVFDEYMDTIFKYSSNLVLIYSSDFASASEIHVRHRQFTSTIASKFPHWELIKKMENPHPYLGDNKMGSLANFYLYQKTES